MEQSKQHKKRRLSMDSEPPNTSNASTSSISCSSQPFLWLTRLQNAPTSHNQFGVGLRELLGEEFESCLLTNYEVDLPWLLAECPRLTQKPVLLVHDQRDCARLAAECNSYANITLVAPYLPIPYGTHHTKMMVILHATSVRVVICTANFVAGDWNHKTQGVWFQDFPLKTKSTTSRTNNKKTKHQQDQDLIDLTCSSPEMTQPTATSSSARPSQPLRSMASLATKEQEPIVDFERDLIEYLCALGSKMASSSIVKRLLSFDFSSAQVALIPSVPGYHKGKEMHKYGHMRVRRLLKTLESPVNTNPLICQFSSLGSLDEKWLFGEFGASMMPGWEFIRSFASSSSKSKKPSDTGLCAPAKSLHIIWPSVEDVRNSNEGWRAGGSIPCPLKNMKPFLHKYLRKWSPPACLHRQNAMPHIKSYARWNPDADETGEVDWAILTSANLSKAAWGSLQKNNTQVMIRSYELGVLFHPALIKQQQSKRLAIAGSKVLTTHNDEFVVLPLPYSFPLQGYNPTTEEPWVWDFVRESPDIYGHCYLPQ